MSIFVLLHVGIKGIEVMRHSVDGDSLARQMKDFQRTENEAAAAREESEVSEWIDSIYRHRNDDSTIPVSTKDEIRGAWRYENMVRDLSEPGQDLNHDWRGDLPGSDSTKNLVGRWERQTLTWEIWELLSPSPDPGLPRMHLIDDAPGCDGLCKGLC
jgi:hypothetical protein